MASPTAGDSLCCSDGIGCVSLRRPQRGHVSVVSADWLGSTRTRYPAWSIFTPRRSMDCTRADETCAGTGKITQCDRRDWNFTCRCQSARAVSSSRRRLLRMPDIGRACPRDSCCIELEDIIRLRVRWLLLQGSGSVRSSRPVVPCGSDRAADRWHPSRQPSAHASVALRCHGSR